MAPQPAAPPALQRVCPHCSAIAVTPEPRCPWCRRAYRRRLLPALVVLALVQSALLLGGVALLLGSFGSTLEDELDDQVTRVERTFEEDLDDLDTSVRRELRRELDARLPAPAAPPPPTE